MAVTLMVAKFYDDPDLTVHTVSVEGELIKVYVRPDGVAGYSMEAEGASTPEIAEKAMAEAAKDPAGEL